MRIGIDYTSAVRQRAGIGRYTRSLIHALAQEDAKNRYVLLVPSNPRDWAAEQGWTKEPPPGQRPSQPSGDGIAGNFRFARAPLTERGLAILWQRLVLPVPAEIFTGPVDVFYSPDFVLPPSRAKQKILTIHDLSFKRVPETAVPNLKWYLEGAVPRAVRQADLIFADSNATRTDLIELFAVEPDRVRTLYSGVEDYFCRVTDDATLSRVRTQYKLTKPFILSVGTIEPRKNLVRLIKAFSDLPAAGDIELIAVGGRGWLFDEIYCAPAEFGVTERVRFLGFVPESDLPALYSLATLFVYPSLYEGFGLPVLEALACGAAVVASNNSSLPEVAGDAAILIDPRDTDALMTTIARLLEDEKARRELAQRGPERARRFSWHASARQLRAALEGELAP